MKPFEFNSLHAWYQDVLEVDEDSMHSSHPDPLPTFWGHMLFEGEYLEILTICMICGHGIQSCGCDDD